MAAGATLGLLLLAACAIAAAFVGRIAARRIRQAQAELQECRARLEEAREAARGAAAEYAALLETTKTGVLWLGIDGRVQRANSAARRLLGPHGNLEGLTLPEVLLTPGAEDLLKSGRHSPAATEVALPGTPRRILNVQVHPVENPDLEGRILVLIDDVTEQRRLEAVRRDFVANVSHELRTPLASIRALAETLRGGALEDPAVAHRFLDTVISEAERLDRISRDLLILSQAETRPPRKEWMDLAATIRRVCGRFYDLAQERSLLLDTDVPEPLPIHAAADQMEQVLVNLLDNALKYTPPGGRITVWARKEAGQVHVCVRDTGIGIMQQDQPRIFERFYRVDPARSRQTGGTGLGLAIVKHIVEAHEGHVWVRSEYNRGSEFGFAVPAAREAPSNGERPNNGGAPEANGKERVQ